MGGPGSGARRKPQPPVELGTLGDTLEEIGASCDRIYALLAADKIDPRRVDALLKTARTKMALIGQMKANTELAKINAGVERMEELERLGDAREVRIRQGVPKQRSDA